MRFLRSDAEVVHAAAGEKRRIVPVGPRNRDVAAVILQYGDVGQVLHDAVGFGRGDILVRDGRRIHADVIGDARHPGDVAQLRRIDEHAGFDLPEPPSRRTPSRHTSFPRSAVSAAERYHTVRFGSRATSRLKILSPTEGSNITLLTHPVIRAESQP